jgi:DNA polymerase (family 10)
LPAPGAVRSTTLGLRTAAVVDSGGVENELGFEPAPDCRRGSAMENTRIADQLEEIADLLELQNANEFRIRSYRAAARTIRAQSRRVADLVANGEDLTELPNIGRSTAEKIAEIVETGTTQRLEELREQLEVPELGPRRVMQLYRELGISSLDELQKACDEQRVRDLEGFGERMEEKILEGIATLRTTSGRLLYRDAEAYLRSLADHLEGLDAVDAWEVAGSFRRCRETIGDLDVLVRAVDREAASEQILAYAEIADVIGRGREKLSVRLEGGLQVDVRFFDKSSFGAALVYFTGSKSHNIELRRLAQEHGWKLNEYGLFSGERRLAGRSEEAVYSRLKLAWIPPELREDSGEIAAARADELPALLELANVRGDLQSHTVASDGRNSIEEMAAAARERGYQFLAITDHSQRVTMAGGLDDDEVRRHADAIREVDATLDDFWLMAGIEVDVLADGRLDLKEKTLAGLDWVVASIHYDLQQSERKQTERLLAAVKSGVVHCLGHPLDRLIGRRPPLGFDLERVFAACVEHGVHVEINAQPDRLDLPDHHCREARAAGVTFTLGTDAHAAAELDNMRYGVNVARRGWLTRNDVLNTRTARQLRRLLGCD